MNKQKLYPDDDILDIMMEDDSFVKGTLAGVDRSTVKQILSGKSTDVMKNVVIDREKKNKTAQMEASELYMGSVQVKVSLDHLLGEVCLYQGGDIDPITAVDIEDAMWYFGINTGIINSVMNRLEETPIYNRDFVIARGVAPKQGSDGEIRFCFDPDKAPKFLENDRGRVDYKELDIVRTVQDGELLCEWIEGEPGTDGVDIYGNVILAKSPKVTQMRAGNNTRFSEDRKQIYATCDGEVSCRSNVVSVDKVLKLKNVDASTGNIRFIGSIHIEGKVTEGYIVKATQNITVKDVIENAKVSAKNLTVGRGIIGSEEILVEEDLKVDFIESSNVMVKGNIKANVILTSQVTCEGKLSLSGKKGSLIGGCCIARELDILRFGNEAHTRTEVELISLNQLEQEQEELIEQLKNVERKIQKKQVQLNQEQNEGANEKKSVEMQSELLRMMYEKNSYKAKGDLLTQKLEFLRQEYKMRIVVRDRAYPNIRVKICGRIYNSSDVLTKCTFRFDGSDVVVSMN